MVRPVSASASDFPGPLELTLERIQTAALLTVVQGALAVALLIGATLLFAAVLPGRPLRRALREGDLPTALILAAFLLATGLVLSHLVVA